MIPLRIVLASLACLCPFSLAQEPKSDPDKTLIIISTSDIHGNLDNFPRLATLVKNTALNIRTCCWWIQAIIS